MAVPRRGAVADLLGHPLLIAALGAMFAGYGGYVTGQATTNSRIEKIEGDMNRIDTLERWAACATRHIDRLENGGAGPLPCVLEAK